jgi:hypothetical protein
MSITLPEASSPTFTSIWPFGARRRYCSRRRLRLRAGVRNVCTVLVALPGSVGPVGLLASVGVVVGEASGPVIEVHELGDGEGTRGGAGSADVAAELFSKGSDDALDDEGIAGGSLVRLDTAEPKKTTKSFDG